MGETCVIKTSFCEVTVEKVIKQEDGTQIYRVKRNDGKSTEDEELYDYERHELMTDIEYSQSSLRVRLGGTLGNGTTTKMIFHFDDKPEDVHVGKTGETNPYIDAVNRGCQPWYATVTEKLKNMKKKLDFLEEQKANCEKLAREDLELQLEKLHSRLRNTDELEEETSRLQSILDDRNKFIEYKTEFEGKLQKLIDSATQKLDDTNLALEKITTEECLKANIKR